MPSLLRFLMLVLVLVGLVFAAMVALATLVEVTPRPMEEIIPPARLR